MPSDPECLCSAPAAEPSPTQTLRCLLSLLSPLSPAPWAQARAKTTSYKAGHLSFISYILSFGRTERGALALHALARWPVATHINSRQNSSRQVLLKAIWRIPERKVQVLPLVCVFYLWMRFLEVLRSASQTRFEREGKSERETEPSPSYKWWNKRRCMCPVKLH